MSKSQLILKNDQKLSAEESITIQIYSSYYLCVRKTKMNRSILLLRNSIRKRLYCTQVKENEPIKFSTSKAARRNLPSVFKNKTADSMPWYQPYSVVGSVTVFLIYFCVIREENDVDLEFNKTLYDRIKGLEEEQLMQVYRYNKEQGLSVVDIEKRLQEIELQKPIAT